jgi:DNA-binding FadR family transcriptional regulator
MTTPTPAELLAVPGALRTRGERLGTLVVSTLVDDIVSGRCPVGSTLPTETDLGNRFGVSRTVVRESVKLLQDKGLVRIRHGIGTVVCDPQSWDMIDDAVLSALVRNDESLAILDELVSVRASLERDMAAAAAAAAQSEAQTAELRSALKAMERAAEDVAEFAAADVSFHDSVMALSGKRLARAIVTSIHGKARSTGRYHGQTSAVYTELTLVEHRAILAAIEKQDETSAAEAMYNHIMGSWTRRRSARPKWTRTK